MSAITTVRDGVKTDFNAAGAAYFGLAFTATEKWFEVKDNTDEALSVLIIGDQQRTSRLARDRQTIEVDIIAHVRKKLTADTVAEVDALVAVMELMERYYYENARISTVKGTLSNSTLQLPSRKQLSLSGRFYGWARLTFFCVNQN